jgi:aldehyde dehydrogenase (NAD+)
MNTSHTRHFYIDGDWREPLASCDEIPVIDPASETEFARIAMAARPDVDRAVAAARRAFETYAFVPVADRMALLERINAGFMRRKEDLARAMSREMGVPIHSARTVHFPSGPAHLRETIQVLKSFAFDTPRGTTMVAREPIGVCALITPWNFPINQVVCKLAPALAAGCTVVLKPSEVSPVSALIIAEIVHEAGAPPGVFNLVNGDGPGTGESLVAHPDVDMVSFTGSTRAGIAIAKAAADTVKRVGQELGGKSANLLATDADFGRAVPLGVQRCMNNSGQSCVAPTRMLVPRARMAEAVELAARTAESIVVGPPSDESSMIGPVANRAQFEKVQRLIAAGIAEGARLVVGGTGRPDGMPTGFYVKPTIFSDVQPSMAIAREEIFGPVLAIIGYDDEEQAIEIANDTPYGLAAYVQSASLERARAIARRLRAGNVQINYPPVDRGAPFGGYKQSGNGREWGEFGLMEYLEIKGIQGYGAA